MRTASGNEELAIATDLRRHVAPIGDGIAVAGDRTPSLASRLKRRVEAESGVAVEWMRLLRGSTALEGPPEALAADLGVRGGVNLYLITRVEGYEYGRG